MAVFMLRFLICNVFISGIILFLLIVKRIFQNSLTSRMQYNIWFLLLGLLAVPFIPFSPVGFSQMLSWLGILNSSSILNAETLIVDAVGTTPAETVNWINDFTLSVNNETPSAIGFILSGVWLTGILVMIIFMLKSSLRLCRVKRSSLPLQNSQVRRLYNDCLTEMEITKNIPVYSTVFLKSPIIVGLLNPCIYLPIHLISDYNAADMRYMLLHELQHYRHRDAFACYLMNFTGVLYWFNPLVWNALKQMRSDREVACDTSVLKMLTEDSYEDYGNTLINFAEKVSFTPFPFAAGLSGNRKQIKRRIINIASYETPTFGKSLKGMIAFVLIAVLLLGLAPLLSTYAADESHYQWNTSSENITYTDLTAYFQTYEGSFVLYDLENDSWCIHDMERAALRTAPDSTYKIYNALFGLEEGVITPDDSFVPWNKTTYPFEAWNADQTLQSAMRSSVNWYFQALDEQLGHKSIYNYLQKTGYGNENMSGDFSTYWLESSLKISPIEQVELLVKLYHNSFAFAPENISAVKDAIHLSSSETGSLYGKTGTGRVAGQDVNGWFVGYVENYEHTYFFAINISADSNASGANASEIALSILSDMSIWSVFDFYDITAIRY